MKVAIVGAGYAGMATAVELAAQGVGVEVFEASRSLGGRARAVTIGGRTVDNGAHILVGAYRETLRLMSLVGVPSAALRRHRLRLDYPGHLCLAAPPLPAPLHMAWALLSARGLAAADKLAAVRLMRRLKGIDFRLEADRSVADLLADQPARLRRFLWDPLCLASLNTPPDQASAQVFLHVLRDSLGAERAASDLLLPATDFSALFPEPAAAFVERHGGRVRRSCRVGSVGRDADGFRVDGHGPFDRLVLAVAAHHLPPLIAGLPGLERLAAQVRTLDHEPILTCYLAYPPDLRLPFPMVGADGGIAQWFFDRGMLCGQAGLLAAVVSAHGAHEGMDRKDLADRIHEDLKRILPHAPPPSWSQVIVERRATFACRPSLERPPPRTPLPGLLLAGDFVAGDYPATLEGAVRSGVRAARLLIDEPARA